MKNETKEIVDQEEFLMQFYLDIKELQDDWFDIVEDEMTLKSIDRTYRFFEKYMDNLDRGDLSFDDYILYYIQNKSEFSSKQLLEKIWTEANILLDIYFDNKDFFDRYDAKGVDSWLFRSPLKLDYSDLKGLINIPSTEQLDELWGKKKLDIQSLFSIQTELRQYKELIESIINNATALLKKMDSLLTLSEKLKSCPLLFFIFVTYIDDYQSSIGKYIGKERPKRAPEDVEENGKHEAVKPFVIEGKLLDDLYNLCNAVVFYPCPKDQFASIINGGQSKENKEHYRGDIKHLTKAYYLIHMMRLVIPRKQYGYWMEMIIESQHINLSTYNKKWSAITSSDAAIESKEFRKKLDALIEEYKMS